MEKKRFKIFTGYNAIFRHELRVLFFTPLSYVFLVAFLLGLSTCIFLIADFYVTDQATPDLLLGFIPWVSLIFVPALSMTAWNMGGVSREMDLIYSLPVAPIAILLGKFSAGFCLLLIALSMTFPFALTVEFLGDPDAGVMLASYIASALLLGTYLAISLMASALFREQVGGFVAGVAIIFVLMLCGWDVFGKFMIDILPSWVWEALVIFSPITWFTQIGEGLVSFQSLVYFVVTIASGLFITHLFLEERRFGSARQIASIKRLSQYFLGLSFWISCVVVMQFIPGQFDLTEEKEFSLHEGTIDILSKLPKETYVTFFWSESEDSIPSEIKSHAKRIERLISIMAKRSNINLKYVDPKPDTEQEIEALASRMQQVPMSSGDSFFLGIAVNDSKRSGKIPYLDVRRSSSLEYDIAQLLNGLTRDRPKRIGIVSPLLPSSSIVSEKDGLSFILELKKAYDVAVIPFFDKNIPEDLDTLILIGTDILHEDMLYAIDQYLMKGGSIIVMIDPFTRIKPANNMVDLTPAKEINDISDLILSYGIKYDGTEIVGDSNLSSAVSDGEQGYINYPYWLRTKSSNFSLSNPITANLNEVLFAEAGSFSFTKSGKLDALISTTEYSGSVLKEEISKKDPRDLAIDYENSSGKKSLAVFARGPFVSAFSDKEKLGSKHHAESKLDSLVIAIADVDWIFDPFALQKTSINGETVVRPLNDNISFLLNSIEYAAGDEALIGIRSRGKLNRDFARVNELLQDAQEKLKDKELILSNEIKELELKISETVREAGDVDFDFLPQSIKDKIEEFHLKLLSARRELRDIRYSIKAEINTLGRTIAFLNIISGPLMIVILSVVIFNYRRSRALKKNHY